MAIYRIMNIRQIPYSEEVGKYLKRILNILDAEKMIALSYQQVSVLNNVAPFPVCQTNNEMFPEEAKMAIAISKKLVETGLKRNIGEKLVKYELSWGDLLTAITSELEKAG